MGEKQFSLTFEIIQGTQTVKMMAKGRQRIGELRDGKIKWDFGETWVRKGDHRATIRDKLWLDYFFPAADEDNDTYLDESELHVLVKAFMYARANLVEASKREVDEKFADLQKENEEPAEKDTWHAVEDELEKGNELEKDDLGERIEL